MGNEEEKHRILIDGRLNKSSSLLTNTFISVLRNGMQILGVTYQKINDKLFNQNNVINNKNIFL